MVNEIIDKLEAGAQAEGKSLMAKAWAWLKAHWYSYGLGVATGWLVFHVLWPK